jgi:hypothetical protein
MAEESYQRAEASVSERFTRVMNATTSRWGVLTDPSMIGVAVAPLAVAALAAARLDASPGAVMALEALMVVPLAIGLVAVTSLRSARSKLVSWLASKPFAIENMNAVLNGLGEVVEVTFVASVPDTKALNLKLDAVSPECFVSKSPHDGGDPMAIEIRIGIVDSKRNPSGSNHDRFVRIRRLVDEILVPLDREHAIREVRVK